MICMYKALEYLQPLRNRVKYSYYLPNKFNFSFDLYYFIILAMLAYIPGIMGNNNNLCFFNYFIKNFLIQKYFPNFMDTC